MLSSYGLCSVSCWRTPAHEGVRHWLEQATQEATASASHQAARTCHKARSNLPRRSLLGGLSCAGRGTSRQRRSTLGEVRACNRGSMYWSMAAWLLAFSTFWACCCWTSPTALSTAPGCASEPAVVGA